jgi:hypothetical protein
MFYKPLKNLLFGSEACAIRWLQVGERPFVVVKLFARFFCANHKNSDFLKARQTKIFQ